MLLSLYFALALALTITLAGMILKVGTLLGECPDSGRAAKAAAVTIATGYTAVGFGGLILIGAGYVAIAPGELAGLLGALGLASLCLGLGFSNAVVTLRAVVDRAMTPPRPEAPAVPAPEAAPA